MRGGTHEPAARENGQCARSLADEVRRRLEAGFPPHAARGHVADDVLSEEPRCRLGGVARVGILGQQADERPLELLVQRGKHDR